MLMDQGIEDSILPLAEIKSQGAMIVKQPTMLYKLVLLMPIHVYAILQV